jgi:hypothetical protein
MGEVEEREIDRRKRRRRWTESAKEAIVNDIKAI